MNPPIKAHAMFWIQREDTIKVYVECSGDPKGPVVIYCHGGPGDHISPRIRRLFNPSYHIILFDHLFTFIACLPISLYI